MVRVDGYLCIISSLRRERIKFFTITCKDSCEAFFYRYSLLDKEILLYFKFSKSFLMKGNWILSKKIFAYIDMIVRYLFFSLLICWIASSNFSVFNQSCIWGVNTTWSWFIISLMCCQILFFHICLKNFGLYSCKIVISSFFLEGGVFFWCLDIIFVSFW